MGGYFFCIFIHRLQIAGAALGHRAQRLFQNRGESAGFVARRGVVVHLALVHAGVVLPPAYARDQFFAHFAAHRTACE